MTAKFVYSDQYDFRLFGFEKLHAFDAQKFSKAWKLFANGIEDINKFWIKPTIPVSDAQLLKVHTQEYLDSLKNSQTVAWIVEIGLAKYIPNPALQSRLIDPIRLATTGTLLATKAALDYGVAMNFGGGYHHAFRGHGEGFCFFADAALAIQQSRLDGDLKRDDTIIMIDLDAHQANGFQSFFHDDPNVLLYDVYNLNAYPRGFHDQGDPEEFPVRNGETGEDYLNSLYKELPTFIDANQKPALAIYNAGTDILSGDKIGGLNVSYEDIVKRDEFVMSQLISRGIPTVVLTSGGYTKDSHKLVAELARTVKKLALSTHLTPTNSDPVQKIPENSKDDFIRWIKEGQKTSEAVKSLIEKYQLTELHTLITIELIEAAYPGIDLSLFRGYIVDSNYPFGNPDDLNDQEFDKRIKELWVNPPEPW